MLSDFPKLLQGSRGNSSPESHRPRPWQPALTTGPQGTAKDLVDQGGGLGLAIQPRDGSSDHTAPAPRATPTGQRCVLRIQTQPSHRLWGQNRSCAGVEASGEGRQQPSRQGDQQTRAVVATRGPTYSVQSGRQAFCMASMVNRRNSCASSCLPKRMCGAISAGEGGISRSTRCNRGRSSRPPSGQRLRGLSSLGPNQTSDSCRPWGKPHKAREGPGRLSESSRKNLCQDLP